MSDLLEDLATVEEFPSFTNIEGEKFDIVKDFNADLIMEPYLREIFLGNTEQAIEELHKVRLAKVWIQAYEHDLIIAFWLAVHMENIELAQ